MLVALRPPEQSSDFTPHSPTPDPLAEDRRRHLIELFNQAFPGGVSNPFTITSLALPPDERFNRLPFILANIVITNAETNRGHPSQPRAFFQKFWCLWDTGTQSSTIAAHLLDPGREKQ